MLKGTFTFILIILAQNPVLLGMAPYQNARIQEVAQTAGLVAFWDFLQTTNDTLSSYYDDQVVSRSFPVYLKRINDPKRYCPNEWPYSDEHSKLLTDSSGPFGHAVRFNQGYIFGEVPRETFDGSALDIHGKSPFTMIA